MIDVTKMRCHADEVAELLKTMAHPERLMVLCQLSKGEVPVRELQESSRLGQSAFSQHMAVLKTHKLVTYRKEAQQVFYSLADKRARQVIEALQKICCMEKL